MFIIRIHKLFEKHLIAAHRVAVELNAFWYESWVLKWDFQLSEYSKQFAEEESKDTETTINWPDKSIRVAFLATIIGIIIGIINYQLIVN